MKAIRYDHTGGPEVLEFVELADPEPMPRDVVIAVEACALNRLDVLQREGSYQMVGFSYPHVPGMDVAGRVVEVGSAVTRVNVGDRVVVDPSLAGVPEGATHHGRGNLFGDLAVIGATVDGGYARAVSGAGDARVRRAGVDADRARRGVPDVLDDRAPRAVRRGQAGSRRDRDDPRRRRRRVRRGNPARQAGRRDGARHGRNGREVRQGARARSGPRAQQPD